MINGQQCQCPQGPLLRGRKSFCGSAALTGRRELRQNSIARRCSLQVDSFAVPGRPSLLGISPQVADSSGAHDAVLRAQVRAQDFPKPDFESSSSFRDAAALSAGIPRPARCFRLFGHLSRRLLKPLCSVLLARITGTHRMLRD